MRSDEKTFSIIVKEYEKPLYLHIRRMVVSHEDARDILQNTFIKAFQKLWTVRKEEGLKAWLYRIATNESLDFLKRSGRQEALADKLEEVLTASEQVNLDRAEIELQRTLVTLPEKQRLAFSLRYYDEMDYEEMSKATGMSKDTLKVNFHLAKEKIRKRIESI